MGFLSIKGNSIYFTPTAEKKVVRPLLRKPVGKWVYNIPSCVVATPQGKKTLRKFKTVDADFSRWMRDNPDPLWDRLHATDQFKQNGDRVDFPVRPQHVLAIWSYADNDVKIVKQGNQFFKRMEEFADADGDVTSRDWMCWTEGSGRFGKEYKTSRQEPTQFTSPIDSDTLNNKIQTMMTQALSDLLPFKTEEALLHYINGVTDAVALPQGQQHQQLTDGNQQPQNAVPGYVPGGQSAVGFSGAPAQQEQVQQPQQQTQPQQAQPQQQTQPQQQAQPQQQFQYQPSQPSQQQPQQPQQAQSQQPQQQFNPYMAPEQVQQFQQPQQQNYTPQSAQTQPQQQGVPQYSYTPQASQQGASAPQAPQQATPPPQASQETEIPNAPVSTQPVLAPPVQAPQQQQPQQQLAASPQNNDPAAILLDFGKYKGKTLGWIKDNDAQYLTFLKGNKKQYAPAIEQILAGVVAQPPGQPQAPVPQGGNGGVEPDAARATLVRECNEKLMQIPDFQGPGIGTNMVPFLQNTIGTADFSSATVDQLQKLKAAIDQKVAGA